MELYVDSNKELPFYCSIHGRSYEPCSCWFQDIDADPREPFIEGIEDLAGDDNED